MTKILRIESPINYSYASFKVTQSRIDKGLLALPKSLAIKWFPKQDSVIHIYFNDSNILQTINYVSYLSSSTEARIGGVAKWFKDKKIKAGEEIVIQLIDKTNFIYRLIPEKNFISRTKEIQNKFDNSKDEREAISNLNKISKLTDLKQDTIALYEFSRLSKELKAQPRKNKIKKEIRIKKGVPANLRLLIGEIYNGHCQVCDFWFLKKDKTPYYEIHHINNLQGNNLQNLLLVCGNCHNQFTYSSIKQEFKNNWLSKVYFNEIDFTINQAIFNKKLDTPIKNIFT